MNSLIVCSRADVLSTICRFVIQRGDQIEPRLVDPLLKILFTENEKLHYVDNSSCPDDLYLTQHLCLKRPAQSCTPTIPKMKKTKKQRSRTFPSMGSVSKRSITRILVSYLIIRPHLQLCYLMLGILFIAFSGLRTRTVLIAERFSFSTSIIYSNALKQNN